MPLLEAVPNVSEGRDANRIERMAAALAAVPGVSLLHRTSDPDHHRTVFTLAGEPAPLERALLDLFEIAVSEIDLRGHRGVHPRVGVVDVAPFVPLGADASFADAIAAAEHLGAEVARRFELPVFLYERAARAAHRRELPDVRRGGFEGLAEKLRDPAWLPDFGPPRPHSTAGAAIVGARDLLVAWNVVLDSSDVALARAIARAVRAATPGGLPMVRALGVPLPRLGRAQVTMNLLDWRVTPPEAAFERVAREAARLGARPIASELIGLIPEAALPADPARLLLPDPSEQALERRLAVAGLPSASIAPG